MSGYLCQLSVRRRARRSLLKTRLARRTEKSSSRSSILVMWHFCSWCITQTLTVFGLTSVLKESSSANGQFCHGDQAEPSVDQVSSLSALVKCNAIPYVDSAVLSLPSIRLCTTAHVLPQPLRP